MQSNYRHAKRTKSKRSLLTVFFFFAPQVTRNNAKCTQSELEYKCEKLTGEKNNLSEQLQQMQELANELQVQSQCQMEDKRQLSSVLSETQRNLNETERKAMDLEDELADLKKIRREEVRFCRFVRSDSRELSFESNEQN